MGRKSFEDAKEQFNKVIKDNKSLKIVYEDRKEHYKNFTKDELIVENLLLDKELNKYYGEDYSIFIASLIAVLSAFLCTYFVEVLDKHGSIMLLICAVFSIFVILLMYIFPKSKLKKDTIYREYLLICKAIVERQLNK